MFGCLVMCSKTVHVRVELQLMHVVHHFIQTSLCAFYFVFFSLIYFYFIVYNFITLLSFIIIYNYF